MSQMRRNNFLKLELKIVHFHHLIHIIKIAPLNLTEKDFVSLKSLSKNDSLII